MVKWKIDSYEEFFNLLGTTEEELAKILQQKTEYYAQYYKVPKKTGMRTIYIVDKMFGLYEIQKQVTANFLNKIMTADSAYGFKRGRSYIDFLIPHTSFYKDRNYLRIDIESFFETISYSLLEEVFSYYFEVSDNFNEAQKEKLLSYLLEIITYRGKVVQGAVTSPVVSNIVFRQLDIRIEKYCKQLDVEYTRYADDLLFSSSGRIIHSRKFIRRIDEILKSKGFNINYLKTIRARNELSLNGYVVSNSIRLSRKKLENLSRVLFFIEGRKWKNSENDFMELSNKVKSEKSDLRHPSNIEFGKYSLINFLAGHRAFLLSVMKHSEDEIFIDKSKRIVKRIEDTIRRINSTKA